MTQTNESPEKAQPRDGPKRAYRGRTEIDPRIIVAGKVLDHVRHTYEPTMSLSDIAVFSELTKQGVSNMLSGSRDPLLPTALGICAALDVDLGRLCQRIDSLGDEEDDYDDKMVGKLAGKVRCQLGKKPVPYETVRDRLSEVFRVALEPHKLRAGKDAIEALLGSSRQSAYDLIGSKLEQDAGKYRPVRLGTLWAISTGLGISLGRLLSELSRPEIDIRRALSRARLSR